jgi:hypothetical protein
MTQIPIRTLSSARAVLCSRAHAIRVAERMADDGFVVSVVATLDPLQPWRVIEHDGAAASITGNSRVSEAAGGEHVACA